jgi:hypothetical protein
MHVARWSRLALGKLGRRGCFLLFLAQLDYIYGLSLLLPTASSLKTPQNEFLIAIMPLSRWAWLWLVVGVACTVSAFRVRDGIGYAAAMFLKMLWASVFLLGWLFADVERAYLSAAVWFAFAAVVYLISTWPDDYKAAADE